LPAPPTGPNKTVALQAKSSEKFPHANLPTVVAPDAEPVDAEGETVLKTSAAELAPTAMAPPINALAIRPTEMSMEAQQAPAGLAGPQSATQYAVHGADAGTQPEQALPDPARPSLTDYPVMPGGQRPFSSDLAPSNLRNPQRSPYADAPLDPHHAASLMSPVGQSYPQTDWERAAQTSAKAMPPWKLAALFVAAVGGALLLTIVIAKIFS
jgi:hypothetical protein